MDPPLKRMKSDPQSKSLLIWFQLIDLTTGEPYKETRAGKVSVSSSADVVDFQDAVKAKNSNKLSSVDTSDLLVYKNKAAFVGKEEPLKSSRLLHGLGETDEEEDMVIVVVPSLIQAEEDFPSTKRQKSKAGIRNIQAQLTEWMEIADNLRFDAANVIIDTPPDLFGMMCFNGIFIREEYQIVLKIINDAQTKSNKLNKFLILGSPGIGKSVFGILMFLLAIQKRNHAAYKAWNSCVIYYFTWNGSMYNVTKSPQDAVTYEGYLDGDEKGEFSIFRCIKPIYLFASPRGENYNTFKKEGCFIIYMNPWCKEECMKLAAAHDFEDECSRRFNLIGGKPRYIFSASHEYENFVTNVCQSIPKNTEELSDHIRNVIDDTFYHEMKHILYSIFRSDRMVGESFVAFSSLTVEAMMLAQYNIQKADELRMFLKTSNKDLQTWRGKMMEQFLLLEVATKMFCMRPLEGDGTVQHFGPLLAHSSIIQNEMQISNELKLFIPLSKTFPSIDAVLVIPKNRIIIYLQATVSIHHSIKYQYLDRVYQHLSAHEDFKDYAHAFLFIVPDDAYASFQRQPFLNVDGKARRTRIGINIKQYVGSIIRSMP
jgi:hypothetical protein